MLSAGENTIVVSVTDPEDLSEIPHGKQGEPWYQRVSGIWQDVTLAFVPETRVEMLRATPDLETDSVELALETTATTADVLAADVTATVVVSREGDDVARAEAPLETDGSASVSLEIDDPNYWTPENPTLYDVGVTLERTDASDAGSDSSDDADSTVLDRYTDYFGMRSVASRNGRIYLNGEPYFIRGALEQGYYPETLYRPFDDDWFETEVQLAKDLGFNLLRKHIKPAHPDFLEQADRQGLLVWEEPANPTVHSERSKREVREQLEGLLERDYNRPSVVIWSIYNEEWGIGNPQGLDVETSLWEDEAKQQYLAELYAETKAADPTRLVCDNSGWAHVATDVNDYHRYFVSPDRAEAWASDLDRISDRPEANYAATVTDPQDAPIIISEFGTWGLCDAPAIEASSDGRPPWLDYEFLEAGLKRPEGYRERFDETSLSAAFETVDELVEAWQWRQFRSNADVIEQMRTRDEIAGYVITEFSDIEWEFNGILDYRREPKAFTDEFARLNAPVAVSLEFDSRVVWDDGSITADAVVINDTNEQLEETLSWRIGEYSDQQSVTVEPASTTRLEDCLTIDAPAVEDVTSVTATLEFGDARTDAAVTVVSRAAFDGSITAVAGEPSIYVAPALQASIGAALEYRGVTVVDVITDSDGDTVDLVITSETTDAVLEYAADGGDVVLLADGDGTVTDETVFDYRDLPEDESWNLVASLLYAVDDDFEELLGRVLGWELEGLYPYTVATDMPAAAAVSVGSVEGWLANASATIAAASTETGAFGCVRSGLPCLGDGPTAHRGNEQPMAAALLETLLADALEG